MSLIGKNIGNYRITAKLGEGGMGTVYLGEHPLIGKRVAIKVLLEELSSKEEIVQRFFNEAKAVNDIGHPNIVDIVDFGRTSEGGRQLVYFIMEYLDGEALSARMRRIGLTFAETLHVIAQCCSALAASHQKGIVHRDIKPDNIFLVTRGGDRNFTKLLDFGIAKLTGDGDTSHKTRTGLVIGTPWYMSPEQCEGKGLIDYRSDVYSLGVVLYELLTGRVPFPGEGFGEVLIAQMTQLPPPPSHVNPQVPPELEEVVLRALEKDRSRRFQSMDEFLLAVEAQGGYASHGFTASATTGYGAPQRTHTTLSGAASELRSPAGRSSMGVALALTGALVMVGVAGLVAYKAFGKSTPAQPAAASLALPEEPAPPAAPPPPEAPKEITIHVVSDPEGARVYRTDGTLLGGTPLEIMARAGAPAFDIEIRLDGHKPQRRQIVPKSDVELVVEFVKNVTPRVQAAPVRPARKSIARPQSKAKTGPAQPGKPKREEKDFQLLKPKVFD